MKFTQGVIVYAVYYAIVWGIDIVNPGKSY